MIWKEKTKKILNEISKLEIIYSKKFGVDYEYDFADSRSNEEILADIKDCIENNHLQTFTSDDDDDGLYDY